MKKYSLYFQVIVFIILYLALNSSNIHAKSFQTELNYIQKDSLKENTVVCYEVFGMDCPGCQSALEKQVKKIEGVADVKASFKEKEVLIKLKPGAFVSNEEIEKRIKKANFTPGKKKSTVGNDE